MSKQQSPSLSLNPDEIRELATYFFNWKDDRYFRFNNPTLCKHMERAADALPNLLDAIELLQAALREALPFVHDGIIECHGDKCRLPNCASCYMTPRSANWAVINAGSAVLTEEKKVGSE